MPDYPESTGKNLLIDCGQTFSLYQSPRAESAWVVEQSLAGAMDIEMDVVSGSSGKPISRVYKHGLTLGRKPKKYRCGPTQRFYELVES